MQVPEDASLVDGPRVVAAGLGARHRVGRRGLFHSLFLSRIGTPPRGPALALARFILVLAPGFFLFLLPISIPLSTSLFFFNSFPPSRSRTWPVQPPPLPGHQHTYGSYIMRPYLHVCVKYLAPVCQRATTDQRDSGAPRPCLSPGAASSLFFFLVSFLCRCLGPCDRQEPSFQPDQQGPAETRP